MVKGELIIGAVANKVGRDGKIVSLLRPCVDCGLVTGSFCESSCFAEDWLGSKHEDWNDNQSTPRCTACDARYKHCHFCLGKAWVTPEPHHSLKTPTSELHMDEVLQRDAATRMTMSQASDSIPGFGPVVRGASGDTSSSSEDAHLPDLDNYVHVVHNYDGVLAQSFDELLARSETPPTSVVRHPSSPTRLSRE